MCLYGTSDKVLAFIGIEGECKNYHFVLESSAFCCA